MRLALDKGLDKYLDKGNLDKGLGINQCYQ
jgi:hypothetical protein